MKSKELKIWLLKNDFTQAQIARDLGKTKGLVCHTVKGRERNLGVLMWLLEHGCPISILKLSKKEKTTIKQIAEQKAIKPELMEIQP